MFSREVTVFPLRKRMFFALTSQIGTRARRIRRAKRKGSSHPRGPAPGEASRQGRAAREATRTSRASSHAAESSQVDDSSKATKHRVVRRCRSSTGTSTPPRVLRPILRCARYFLSGAVLVDHRYPSRYPPRDARDVTQIRTLIEPVRALRRASRESRDLPIN